jgi:hypothetical protein
MVQRLAFSNLRNAMLFFPPRLAKKAAVRYL